MEFVDHVKSFPTSEKMPLYGGKKVERLAACKKSSRLQLLAAELTELVTEDQRAKIQRQRWPGAPYLHSVDNKFHVRLLAMTRLGILPIEIETGRWHGMPRETRLCKLGCDHVGDTDHFLHSCAHIKAEHSLNRYAMDNDTAQNPFRHWRNIAHRLECRWRERTQKLRKASDEPQHPAASHDANVAEEIDAAAMQQISANDIRFYCAIK